MTTLATPDELEHLATDLQRQATRLRQERTELGDSMSSVTWEGPGGTRFRERARARLTDLDSAADELEAAARALKGSAEATAKERRALTNTEDDVRMLRTALGPAAFAGRLKAAGVTALPASGDPAWRSIGHKLLGGGR